MHENAWKRIKTEADGSLTTQYEGNEVFITNTEATGFLAKWTLLEKLNAKVEALESEKEKNKERDSRLEALEQKLWPEELV